MHYKQSQDNMKFYLPDFNMQAVMSGDAKQKRTQRTHFKNTVSSKSDKKYG